jgi:hypothetical protein
MTATLATVTLAGALHIVANLREWDRREIFACKWSDDPELVANQVVNIPGPKWMALCDDRPAALMGCMPLWPGVFAPWCFGTDDFRRVSLLLTRLGRRAIIPGVRASGGHRMEAKSLDGHEDAQAWLERCFGFEREATHRGYGRAGETFHTYALRL